MLLQEGILRFELSWTAVLYERKTVYDKEKKQTSKITGVYLGCITLEGFISKKSAIILASPIPDLEYGASKCLHGLSSDIRE